jgi:hypothetical protein
MARMITSCTFIARSILESAVAEKEEEAQETILEVASKCRCSFVCGRHRRRLQNSWRPESDTRYFLQSPIRLAVVVMVARVLNGPEALL